MSFYLDIISKLRYNIIVIKEELSMTKVIVIYTYQTGEIFKKVTYSSIQAAAEDGIKACENMICDPSVEEVHIWMNRLCK